MKRSSFERDGTELSFKIVLASIVGVWLCYYILSTARGFVVGFELPETLLWRRIIVCLAGAAMTFVLWMFLRAFDEHPLWQKIAVVLLIALPCSLGIAQVNRWVFSPVEKEMVRLKGERDGTAMRIDEAGNVLMDIPLQPDAPPGAAAAAEPGNASRTIVLEAAPTGLKRWRQHIDIALNHYYLLLAWASLYLALLAGTQATAAARREEEFRNAAKAAELRSLRYQINPHFLFNTLNSLSALVVTERTEAAERMIQTISRFYRHSLADDPTADVPLADEFAMQRLYLDIEKIRFPNRLRFQFDLPPALERMTIPGMLLQPIVENSVKYAVARSKEPTTIHIAAREEAHWLVVTISDDGSAHTPGNGGFGIGLANVRDRLTARFGTLASVSSGPVFGGYETEIRMPLIRHD